MLVLETKMKVL